MLVVGLTGGIASGKSTVSKLISQHPSKIPLIDLDVLARKVVEPGQPALKALVKEFGESILEEDGSLNRPALGRLVFGDEERRKILNRLTHGAIRRRMAWEILIHWIKGEKVVVVDTPLLVEAGMWKWCGEMVLVWCPPEDQLSRMLKRDSSKGLTEEDAKKRLASQLSLSEKLVYADAILDNSTPLDPDGHPSDVTEKLREQVERLVQRWLEQNGGVGGGMIPRLRWILEWLVPPFGLLMGYLTTLRRTRSVEARISSGKGVSVPEARSKL